MRESDWGCRTFRTTPAPALQAADGNAVTGAVRRSPVLLALSIVGLVIEIADGVGCLYV